RASPNASCVPRIADPRGICSFPPRRSSDLPEISQLLRAGKGSVSSDDHQAVDAIFLTDSCCLLLSFFSTHLLAARCLKDGTSPLDRKSTRLNSTHVSISYAVFCLKKSTSDR